MQVTCQELEKDEREKYMGERQKKIIAAEAKLIAKQQNEMNALKKKLEANLNERLKVRETEHNKLLKRYQNVKREIEKQHNIERNKFEKSMQGYISKNRPATAKGANPGASVMGSRMGGSQMPASKPSNLAALMSPLPGMKVGAGPKAQSRGINWEEIAQKMPTSKTDPVQIKRRAELWKYFDNNGNGYASLAETQKGIRDGLQLEDLFEAKAAVIKAFNFAKDAVPGKAKYGADYLEKKEFRIFLVALRQRFEYFQAFKRIDAGGDGRIDLAEFVGARRIIEKWVGKMSDPEKEFKSIDKNGGGQILFDEFCDWSVKKNLDLDDDNDYQGN
jgi:Ca2+-binding EF-hand superfamily protein